MFCEYFWIATSETYTVADLDKFFSVIFAKQKQALAR